MKKIWLGAFAALAMACSSSGGGGPAPTGDTGPGGGGDSGPGGSDTGSPVDSGGPKVDTGTREVSVVDTGSAGEGGATENTTGKTCTANAECDPLGTGDNACSNGLFKSGTLYPSPVCIGKTCDPGAGTTIVGCDNNLGVCLSTGTGGICLPVCGFDDSGAAPTGCQGKDGCNVYGWGTDPTTKKVNGVGYCFGGCSADADCTGGDKCQKESGLCVKAPLTYAKAVGDACGKADASVATGCECLYSSKTSKGYCSQFCQVGTAGTCGTGFSCSALLPKVDTSGAALFTTTPKGISGYCMKNCATDADCTALNATCQDTTDGKVCSPFGP